MDIIYQHLTQQQIGPELFSGFDRWQNVTRCWRKENGSWVLRDIAFIDDWNEEEYIFLYDCLKKYPQHRRRCHRRFGRQSAARLCFGGKSAVWSAK